MSKRHATFAVSQNGRRHRARSGLDQRVICGAGQWRSHASAAERRFPAADFTDAPQFGDVPVDFIRVEQPVSDTFVVPDLFGYALETVKQEPDVADMSVDDS